MTLAEELQERTEGVREPARPVSVCPSANSRRACGELGDGRRGPFVSSPSEEILGNIGVPLKELIIQRLFLEAAGR